MVDDLISYERLGKAQVHYNALGYFNIETPWLVSPQAIYTTLPKDSTPYLSNAGALVGSAEQGFVQMMMEGTLKPGKYQSISACFRDEKVYNALTKKWFMKLELCEYLLNDKELEMETVRKAYERMINEALQVMRKLTGADHFEGFTAQQTTEGYDILYRGIELGSYGVRQMDNHVWVYGTGLAEPRFTVATEYIVFEKPMPQEEVQPLTFAPAAIDDASEVPTEGGSLSQIAAGRTQTPGAN